MCTSTRIWSDFCLVRSGSIQRLPVLPERKAFLASQLSEGRLEIPVSLAIQARQEERDLLVHPLLGRKAIQVLQASQGERALLEVKEYRAFPSLARMEQKEPQGPQVR